MLNYATVGSNRLEEAKAFYDELLGLIGMTPFLEHFSGGRIYASSDRRLFGVLSHQIFIVGFEVQVTFMLDRAHDVVGMEPLVGCRCPDDGKIGFVRRIYHYKTDGSRGRSTYPSQKHPLPR